MSQPATATASTGGSPTTVGRRLCFGRGRGADRKKEGDPEGSGMGGLGPQKTWVLGERPELKVAGHPPPARSNCCAFSPCARAPTCVAAQATLHPAASGVCSWSVDDRPFLTRIQLTYVSCTACWRPSNHSIDQGILGAAWRRPQGLVGGVGERRQGETGAGVHPGWERPGVAGQGRVVKLRGLGAPPTWHVLLLCFAAILWSAVLIFALPPSGTRAGRQFGTHTHTHTHTYARAYT
jgi:hypothetical protein